jgi:uncharacterized protein YjeT (DUF2065 family)
MMKSVLATPDTALRITGLVSTLLGLFIIWLVRWH